MVKRTDKTTQTGLTAGEIDPTVDDEETLDDALARVVNELGGDDGVTLNIYRITPGQRQEEYLESYLPSEVEGEISLFKRIRDEHGPGEYRIQVRDGKHFRLNRRQKIGGAPKAVAKAEDAALNGIATLINASNQRMEQLIEKMLVAVARPQENEEVWMRRLAMMRQIFTVPAAPAIDAGAQVAQLFNVFKEGLSLGKEVNPTTGAGAEDVMLETIRTLGPELINQVKRIEKAEDKMPPQPKPPKPAAAPVPTPNAQVKQLLDILVSAAAQNSDPLLYADFMYDQIGPDALAEIFEKGDPVALLSMLDKRVQVHHDWFVQLRDSLKGIMDETTHSENAVAAIGGGRASDLAGDESIDAGGSE